METETGNVIVEKKGEKRDSANDVVIQIADTKENIEATEHENLSSRNQLSISPDTSGSEMVEENVRLLNSPANQFTYSTAAEEYLESYSEEEEDDEDYHKDKSTRKVLNKPFVLIEWIAFMCIIVLLICSLTVNRLQNHVIWDFNLWKWCVLALVICCGRLFTEWVVNVLLFLIESNFSLQRRFMYYVYGLRKIIRVFIWLSLILLARILLFRHWVKRSKETTKVLNYITRALASSLVGAALWLLKSFSVQLLAVSFQSKRFFNPIQETIFHQYLLQALSGPPLVELNEQYCEIEAIGMLKGKGKYVIDVQKLKKMKRQKISAWTMKKLIDVARSSKLSFYSNKLDECDEEEDGGKEESLKIFKENVRSDEEQALYKGIKSELEAEYVGNLIFANVAKPGYDYIRKEDLHRFLITEEVRRLLTMFEGATKTRKIPKSEFKKWVVYNERKALSHFIKQAKAATQELNRLFTAIVIFFIIILWLLLMGFLTTQALVFIISQLVLAAFMFGNTVKNIFESIIFLYVMHPFDVGDRCIIDGVQMVVEEIHILTTTFVRYDNEKVFYPNSVLATKPINNLYRSTGNMRDSVEFVIDASVSIETIEALKSKIQDYLTSNPEHWRPQHKLVVKEIEDANKIRMVLQVTHNTNFQNYGEKSSRRSKIVLQLKQIFEELGISKYHVLPQPQVSSEGSAASAAPQPTN